MKATAIASFLLILAGVGCTPVTGPQTPYGPPPEAFTLEQNFPNPFTDSTHVRFGAPVNGGYNSEMSVVVYDSYESQVRILYHTYNASPGMYQTTWDGRDEDYRLVPGGVYIIELRGYSPMTAIKRIAAIKR